MTALLIVCLLPWASVLVQHMQWTNAFATVKGVKPAMRPLVKLLFPLIFLVIFIVLCLCHFILFSAAVHYCKWRYTNSFCDL